MSYTYSDAIPRPGGYFLPGAEDIPIYLDNVQCIGDENLLINCDHSLLTEEDSHDEDAGVTCFVPGEFIHIVSGHVTNGPYCIEKVSYRKGFIYM